MLSFWTRFLFDKRTRPSHRQTRSLSLSLYIYIYIYIFLYMVEVRKRIVVSDRFYVHEPASAAVGLHRTPWCRLLRFFNCRSRAFRRTIGLELSGRPRHSSAHLLISTAARPAGQRPSRIGLFALAASPYVIGLFALRSLVVAYGAGSCLLCVFYTNNVSFG